VIICEKDNVSDNILTKTWVYVKSGYFLVLSKENTEGIRVQCEWLKTDV